MSKPFGRKKNKLSETEIAQMKDNAMIEAIANHSDDDPLIRAKITAKDLKLNVIEILKDDRGVRIEDALGILGAFAGFACSFYGTEKYKKDPTQKIEIIGTKDGKQYVFGDVINGPLVNDQYSVYSLVAGMAQSFGVQDIITPNWLISRRMKSIGTPDFGIPVLPEKHSLRDTPYNFVLHLWPKLVPVMRRYNATLGELPIVNALAIQELMTEAKDVIDPEISASIALQSAFSMSVIIPADLAKNMS